MIERFFDTIGTDGTLCSAYVRAKSMRILSVNMWMRPPKGGSIHEFKNDVLDFHEFTNERKMASFTIPRTGFQFTNHNQQICRNSRIRKQIFQCSRFRERYFFFSRITNEIVFTNSRTIFLIFTNSRTKKSRFSLARTPLGASGSERNSFNLREIFSQFCILGS